MSQSIELIQAVRKLLRDKTYIPETDINDLTNEIISYFLAYLKYNEKGE